MSVSPWLASTAGAQTGGDTGAVALYRQLLHPTFDVADVHTVRQVNIDREDLHITLIDGVITLMRQVDGHVTGAFFEGEGNVLLLAPDRAERTSLALYTGAGLLDQKFTAAYLRFFDDKLVEELRAGFRPIDNPQDYVDKWQEPARALATADGLPMLQSMINAPESGSRYIHLRAVGTAVGAFDVVFNTNSTEQISVAQAGINRDVAYYDIWTAFAMRSMREKRRDSSVNLPLRATDFRIRAKVLPPSDMEAEAEITLVASKPGQRAAVLQLSRYLRVIEVKAEGRPLEFVQNEAVGGSDLARNGNDLVAIVFPQSLEPNHPVHLSFKYSGAVMFDAGGDLLYVGARGTWYPNPGPSFANFDVTFEYPPDWTLVATGRRISSTTREGMQVTQYVSDKPIAHAGFNLGKFESATASSGEVVIDSYATKTVEPQIARLAAQAGQHPDPAKEVQRTATQAAATVQFLSAQLAPFPYSHLEVTQLPALLSQSWPGLIYLSSMAFLTPEERRGMGVHDPFWELLMNELMLAHETAHQWWGDAVAWDSYRDEWIIEALANYSALVMLEREDPAKLRLVLDHYRTQLLKPAGNGIMGDAGPVTLGPRLTSSKFPDAFDLVLYGRGTWLIHTLRTMLRQAGGANNDALFFSALKDLLSQSPNGKISTRDLQHAFEKVMPASLAYEGRRSLDWFFDSWINGAAIPQFSLGELRITPAGSRVKVSGTISEEYAPKDMVTAVPVYATNKEGRSKFAGFVFVDEAKTDFEITAPADTTGLLLDPQETLLRR